MDEMLLQQGVHVGWAGVFGCLWYRLEGRHSLGHEGGLCSSFSICIGACERRVGCLLVAVLLVDGGEVGDVAVLCVNAKAPRPFHATCHAGVPILALSDPPNVFAGAPSTMSWRLSVLARDPWTWFMISRL